MQYTNAEIPMIFNGDRRQILVEEILVSPYLFSSVNFAHTTFRCCIRCQMKMLAPIDEIANDVQSSKR